MKTKTSPCVVLMVDDNPADVLLMSHAVEITGIPVELHSVPNGSSAVAYLQNNPVPDLLVLDFLLNAETGPEILQRIRAETCVQTRAVMLSGLDPRWAEQAGMGSIESHQKPSCFDGWLDLAKRILCPATESASLGCAA